MDKIKAGGDVNTIQDTIKLIDEHYDYFEVPFQNGNIINKPNENTGSAKIFSLGLLTRLDVQQTLRLFGEIYRDLKPDGTDHPNVREFVKNGWSGVTFSTGLAIISKLQAYDDTESCFQTQKSLEGSADWDADADSWIP